jgi:hypothetical protein
MLRDYDWLCISSRLKKRDFTGGIVVDAKEERLKVSSTHFDLVPARAGT